MVCLAYSDRPNVTNETQSDIFFQIDLCRPGCRMGPPASRMINTIDIDVLEQWWLAQFGLVWFHETQSHFHWYSHT